MLLQYEYETLEHVPDTGWVRVWAPCPVRETTLTVAAAPYQYLPVPINSRWLLAGLAILLASAGWMARRKHH